MDETIGTIKQLSHLSRLNLDEDQEYVPVTTISLKNEFGTYTISVNEVGLDIVAIYENLFKPLLLAAGYQIKSIEDNFENHNKGE